MQDGNRSDKTTAASPDNKVAAQLGRILAEAGYTEHRLFELLGSLPPYGSLDLPVYRRLVAADSLLNTFIKLFALGVEVSMEEATRALAPLRLQDLVRLGILRVEDKTVRARVALDPYEGLLLARDLRDQKSEDVPANYVLGVSPPSMNLANLTVRKSAKLALDLGSGCGVQALLASRHCDRVMAVDTNPRAKKLAALNAHINDISNVEWLLGSSFEPVSDLHFDLIVSNPPYVISPDDAYEFRDNDQPDDVFCRSVVQETSRRLAEGGFATIFLNWVHAADGDWSEPLRDWLEGNGCDAWMVRFGSQGPLRYAAGWNRSSDTESYQGNIDRWMEYYGRQGIEAIGLGAIILRRRSRGENWLRVDDLPEINRLTQCSDQILRFFRAQDYLHQRVSNDALLSDRFRLMSGHQLIQELTVQGRKYAVDAMLLKTQMPLSFVASLDIYELALLTKCDGTQTLEDIVFQVAKSSKRGRLEVEQEATNLVRRLLPMGFLEPAVWQEGQKGEDLV